MTTSMISESAYSDCIKKCMQWNRRMQMQRRQGGPVIDQQTGIILKPTRLHRIITHRFHPDGPGKVCTYASRSWVKCDKPSSDYIELKYFIKSNRNIGDVINTSNAVVTSVVSTDNSLPESPAMNQRQLSSIKYEETTEYDEPLEEEIDEISDDDEYNNKKKKGRGRGRGPRKSGINSGNTIINTPKQEIIDTTSSIGNTPEKRFICQACGAKYKSRPGLNYHKQHIHPDIDNVADPSIPDPVINISTTCDFCGGNKRRNKKTGKAEVLVSCHDCGRSCHPSCCGFTENMFTSFKKFGWQCLECKSCAICGTSDNDDKLLFCDDCDHGFHMYCLKPPLEKAPESDWSCDLCKNEYKKNN
ncbi:D4 [Strongyloides ratti]|uniref:D4 n=1 Tax=Strongyloides ratti TaxID=34506 RepID=A0A090KWG8_STRRB|nr:D4 [Strongyloides ratti]CEF61746.1 D4 [Strongyloides ratti]